MTETIIVQNRPKRLQEKIHSIYKAFLEYLVCKRSAIANKVDNLLKQASKKIQSLSDLYQISSGSNLKSITLL